MAPGVFRTLNRAFNTLFALVFLFLVALAGLLVYDGTEPAVSTLMMGRWLTGKPVDRQWTALDDISPRLVAAVVMSEDGQFCMHKGVDWNQVHEVLDDPDGPQRGASTITMQVARNLFLWNGRSFIRKGLEIPLALLLDAVWSKKRVLEVYLNIAEWGDGVFGARAAARRYFDKSVGRLTQREASLMATALPNPFLRDPAMPSRGHRDLAAINMERVQGAAEWIGCLR